jgi:hypothetical protein
MRRQHLVDQGPVFLLRIVFLLYSGRAEQSKLFR